MQEFSRRSRVTWSGRADLLFYKCKLWAIAHGVDADTLPERFSLKGWPSHEQFEFYLRAGHIQHLELRWQNGQSVIEVLDP